MVVSIFPIQAYPVILGDIDNTGSLSAQIIHQFFPNSKSKLVVQVRYLISHASPCQLAER